MNEVKEKRVLLTSGLFDPLHYGHVDYLQKAKALTNGGTLWVVVNSDAQAKKKKGSAFMPEAERLKLIRSLRCVDAVMIAPDHDETVCRAIRAIHPDAFVIGLDEGPEYMKEEREACKEMGIDIICPLGVRVQSSTFLINQAKKNKRKNDKAKEDTKKNTKKSKKN